MGEMNQLVKSSVSGLEFMETSYVLKLGFVAFILLRFNLSKIW